MNIYVPRTPAYTPQKLVIHMFMLHVRLLSYRTHKTVNEHPPTRPVHPTR